MNTVHSLFLVEVKKVNGNVERLLEVRKCVKEWIEKGKLGLTSPHCICMLVRK
jgi:hypothetical protein